MAGSQRQQNTARALIVRGDQLLLMERWRPGLHYFSIPGGGIEPGETSEQAAIREIAEETSLSIVLGREVLQMRDGAIVHTIYLADYQDGEPAMPASAPELLENNENNRFKPGWVSIDQLATIPLLYWEPLRSSLIDGFANGFPAEPTIVSTD